MLVSSRTQDAVCYRFGEEAGSCLESATGFTEKDQLISL